MTDFKNMREIDLDRLLAGGTPPGAEGAAGVAAFARDLRAAYPQEVVSDELAATHMAAMVTAAQELSATAAPAPRRGRSRRRPLRLALRIAFVSAAFLLLFCGLALAGALPPSIEGPVSRAALRVGIHLPAPSVTPVRAQEPSPSPTQTADPSPTAKAHQSADPTPKAQSQTPKPAHIPVQDQSGVQPPSGSSGGGGQDGDGTTSSPADDEQDSPAVDQQDEQDQPQADQTPPPDEQGPPPDEQAPPSDTGTRDRGDGGGSAN